MRLILASSSKQRQEIFDMVGLKYDIITSDVDEVSDEKEPDKYVEELSLIKAKSVAEKVNDKAIIIAADTIIYSNNKKYEKPKNKKEAFMNMKELSNTKHSAYTGVTIIDLYKDKIMTFSTKVDVYFKKITDEELEWYVNNEERLLNCCGYVPTGKASIFIYKIDGDYNTLIGISPSVVFEKLKELGYSVSDFI